jgi:hypothetical protein
MKDNPADAAQRLLGAWRLQAIDHAGNAAQSAARVDGLIMYEPGGYMSAQIISPGADPTSGESEYHAYFGTYSVDLAASAVTHHRLANNHAGAPADVVRRFEFLPGDGLRLTPEGHDGITLTFKRAGS